MTNFSIKVNDGKWKPASHPCRFYFSDSTKIKRQSNDKHPMFPLTPYRFTPFLDVLKHPNIDASDWIDVIGAYNPQEKLKKPTDGSSTWASFHIRDLENKRLHCTLWNEYVGQTDSYLSTPRQDIVLLQLCCINKRWGDSKGIATSFHVSKMPLDEHIPEVEEFRIRFRAMRNSASQPSGLSSSSCISVDDEKEIGFTRTIYQLHSTKKVQGLLVL